MGEHLRGALAAELVGAANGLPSAEASRSVLPALPRTVPVTGVVEPEVGQEIRAFPITSLRESIDKAIASIPEGHHVAVVAYADLKGARMAAYAKLGGGWSFVGVLEKPWKGELKAEAALAWSGL